MSHSNHATFPATARMQKIKRVLMNGIDKFPVWMDVTDPNVALSDGVSKRRIVIDDGTAALFGIDLATTGPEITLSPPTDNDTRPFDYSNMPNLKSDSDDDCVDSIDLLNGDEGVSSDTGTSDSCAVSRKARKYVLRRAKLTALSDDEHLGVAVPAVTTQVPDIEAAHGSTSSSGFTGSSDGSLSDDFIDKNEPILTHLQAKTLMRFFPITCQKMIENGV